MVPFNKRSNTNPNTKKFIYSAAENLGNKHQTQHGQNNATNDLLDKMLKVIGREVLREKTPTLQDLERSLEALSAQQQHEQRDRATAEKVNAVDLKVQARNVSTKASKPKPHHRSTCREIRL